TTLLRACRFDRAVDFVIAHDNVATESLADLLEEARLVSFARLGSIDRAMRVAEAYLRDLHRSNRSVFLCRRAELLAATGALDTAGHILRQLARAQIAAGNRGGVNLRLVLLVVRLLARLADPLALDTAHAGLTASERIGDAVFQHEFLSLMAEHESEPA